MKKLLIALAALFTCVALSAQTKGEKYIAVSAGASFGSETVTAHSASYTNTEKNPLASNLSAMGEFGYFVADNVRLALAVGVPFTSSPKSKTEDNIWLLNNTIGIQINPNIAYYVKLANNFYYTPEIGFSYEFGSYKEEMTGSVSMNLKYNGWDVYANILSLEFRVSKKLAIGANVGNISYASLKITEKGSADYIKYGQFKFNLNSASVHIRFYL